MINLLFAPRRLAVAWLLLVVVVALFTPLLCGVVPVAMFESGDWSAPALFGPSRAPDGRSWASWAVDADTSGVWMVMPVWPLDPLAVDLSMAGAAPSVDHLLGVDRSGRDVLAQAIWGTRTAVFVAVTTAVLSGSVGTVLGVLAGWAGGWVDGFLVRVFEIVAAVPVLLVALAGAALLGPSTSGLVLMLSALVWPSYARVVRAEMLALRAAPFVEAARLRGVSMPLVVWRHVLPQLRGRVAVVSGFIAAGAISVEAALTFLGAGSRSTVSWGGLLAQGQAMAVLGSEWPLWIVPGALLALTAVAVHVALDTSQEWQTRVWR